MSRPVRVAVLVVAVLLVVAGCGSEGPAEVEVVPGAPAGDVRAVRGDVRATRDGVARALAVGDSVSGDDVVTTGSDGDVTIELRHNGAVWTLGAGQSRRVADAAAWNAPKNSGGGSTGERSTAAGRHAEREGADTAASVVAPGAKATGGGAESTSAVTAGSATTPDPAPAEPQSVMRRGDEPPEKVAAKDDEVADKRAPTKKADPPDDRAARKPEKGDPAKDVGGGGGGGCDEVSCLLADPAPACCNKYKGRKPADAPKGEGGGSVLPEALGRTEIKEGIDKVRARALKCGDGTSVKGQVKVAVKVKPDGSVASATVQETPDDAVGACVAGVVKTATFARSQKGGSFSYPFTF